MKAMRGGLGRLAILGLYAVALPLGCGGGGGDDPIPPTFAASFTGSGTAAAPNVVRLRSSSHTGNLVVLEVAIGGPTTSTDLYSFVFDLVLSDPTVATYVAGTDAFGTALTLSGGQTSITQAALSSANRLVVGVSKAGGGAGNGVAVAEAAVVRLTFRVLKAGTTTIKFSGDVSLPAALDSNGANSPSVQFDSASATITGS